MTDWMRERIADEIAKLREQPGIGRCPECGERGKALANARGGEMPMTCENGHYWKATLT